MLYNEYLKIYKGFSKEFHQFLYWCISEDKKPSFARARHDIPYKEILQNLDIEEMNVAQKLIRERLECSNDIFAVELMGCCGDVTDIPLIEKTLSIYKDKAKESGSNFEYCIEVCKKILNILKNK